MPPSPPSPRPSMPRRVVHTSALELPVITDGVKPLDVEQAEGTQPTYHPVSTAISDCCPICLEEMPPYKGEPSQSWYLMDNLQLPCLHRYHKRCAIAWFQNGGQGCPLCRAPTPLDARHEQTSATTARQLRPNPAMRVPPFAAGVGARSIMSRVALALAAGDEGVVYDVHSFGRLDGPIVIRPALPEHRALRPFVAVAITGLVG